MSEFSFKDRVLFFLIEHVGSKLVLALGRTLDIELVNEKNIEKARGLSQSGTMIFAVLHGRMFIPVYVMRNKNIHSIASQSSDGEAVTRIVQRLGYVAFRGSSAKGGAEGMLGLIRVARKVETANMIDGPTGPREVPKIGTVAIAKAAGIPIVPLIGAASPSFELDKAWDRFQLPLPFSRAVLTFGEPMVVPSSVKGDELEQQRQELQKRVVELREWTDARAWSRAMERRGGLLAPVAWGWGAVMNIRNRFFDTAVRRIVPSPIPVVSVGNLTVGGSGKSPLVKEIVHLLEERAGRGGVAIVSRGYRRKSSGMRIVADQKGVHLGAEEGGDEPVMLANSLPGVPVLVAERRPEAISAAAKNLGAKVAVLDDGFQHRAAERKLDVVLLDASTPAHHWRLMPQGRMREGFGALKRADLVVLTGAAPEGIVEGLTDRVRAVCEAPILRGGIVPTGLRRLHNTETVDIGWLAERNVALCAAIARPRRFLDSVESLGAKLVSISLFRDHEPIEMTKLNELFRRAKRKGAEAILITAKDEVKWPGGEIGDIPVYVVETQWRWHVGEGELTAALDRLVAETKIR